MRHSQFKNYRKSHFSLLDWLALILPFGLLLEVTLIGRVFVTEIAFIVLFPFIVKYKLNTKENILFKRIMAIFYLWLFSQIISDLVNNSEFFDYSRGWSRIIITAIDFVVLYSFLNSERRLLLWLLGSSIARGLFALHEFPEYFALAWKFGINLSAYGCITVLVLSWGKREIFFKYKLLAIAYITLGVVSLFINSRSFAAISIITGLILLLASTPRNRYRLARQLRQASWSVVAGGIVICYLFARLYTMGAESGWFGDDARSKYEMQVIRTMDPGLGLLLGGRNESIASTQAIADAPIFGHGSWAKDDAYSYLIGDFLAQGDERSHKQLTEKIRRFSTGLIPKHSHLLGAWVESGLGGALGWFYIMYLIAKRWRLAISASSITDVIVLSYSIFWLWDILFSPFGLTMRLAWAYIFVIIIKQLNIQTNVGFILKPAA